MRVYLEYCAADEEHACPEREGQDFVVCEICQASRHAGDRLHFNAIDIVQLLEVEHAARERLTLRVIQDVDPDKRTPELQEAMMNSLRITSHANQ